MKKSLVGIAAMLLVGCGLPGGHQDCRNGNCLSKGCKTCGVANKISDKKCGNDKCYITVKEPTIVEVPVPAYETVDKECFVTEKKKVVTKVPVKTYKVIDEWVDSQVKEAYFETIKTRVKKKVPVTDVKFGYTKVSADVEKQITCPKTIVTEKNECKPVKISDTLIRYDQCGKVEPLKISREGMVNVHTCEHKVENAVCTVTAKGTEERPGFHDRNVKRNGYYTEEVKVKKYRTVPGKVLRKRRVCETVFIDKVDYVEEKRPVIRQVRVRAKDGVEKKVQYVTKRVEVDCVTGVPLDAANAGSNIAAKKEQTAVASASDTLAPKEQDANNNIHAPESTPNQASAPAAEADAAPTEAVSAIAVPEDVIAAADAGATDFDADVVSDIAEEMEAVNLSDTNEDLSSDEASVIEKAVEDAAQLEALIVPEDMSNQGQAANEPVVIEVDYVDTI